MPEGKSELATLNEISRQSMLFLENANGCKSFGNGITDARCLSKVNVSEQSHV